MAGQTRMTRQRKVILDELKKVCTHPTADEVYEMVRPILPRISLGTVYRNLDLLAESGEILRLEHAGSQKCFDGTTTPHAHIRCTECGRVADVDLPHTLPDYTQIAVKDFTVKNARVEFEGICSSCQKSH